MSMTVTVASELISAEIDDIDNLLPPQPGILLYRILQEGLNNVVKHSGAEMAIVTLKRTDAGIQFDLQDEGRGVDFVNGDPEPEAATDGLGLTILRERVRTLGGTLLLQSLKNMGTRLSFVIPIMNREGGNGELSRNAGG